MGDAMSQPLDRLLQLLNGFRVTQALVVVTKLEIADKLADGPKTAAELAKLASAQSGPLYQVLRAVASLGVFAEDEAGRFFNTPMSEFLRSGAPPVARNTAMLIDAVHWRALGELMHAVRTGTPAFDKAFGVDFFNYLTANDALRAVFDTQMAALYAQQVDAVVEAFDFSKVGRFLDVGGGHGTVVRAVLARHSDVRCGLFDLPSVAERTQKSLAADGLADRCTVEAGSFFERIPTGYDTYLLKHVLHDWGDTKAGEILGNVRHAMPRGGRLLLLEYLVPGGNEPSLAKGFDLLMLALFAGKERSEKEFRDLLDANGFRLERIAPSTTLLSVLEARPV
jgi:O-methyltransferase domain/Dimerisation domain